MQDGNRLYFCIFTVLFTVFSLAACSDKIPKSAPEARYEGDMDAPGSVESLDTEVIVEEEQVTVLEGRTSGPMLPVYFEFDSTLIHGEQVQRIEANADFIKSMPLVRVRIEGNCDPRGTREYNLALGERRALTARKYLINLGVSEERLSTISWGEEKLLLFGHDELSWAQNRRDDFVILK